MGAVESKGGKKICISEASLRMMAANGSPDCERALLSCGDIAQRLRDRVQQLESENFNLTESLRLEKRSGRRWSDQGPISIIQE